MNVISPPKREFDDLAAHLPAMRQVFEQAVAERRQAAARALAQTSEI